MDTAAASRVARIIRDQELFREACYISGPWRPAVGAATISVDDPATGRGHRRCPEIRPRRDARGPRRCGAAYPAWPKRTPKERAAVLRRWSELILANQDDLARLMTREQGKPLAESRGEVVCGASFIEWFAEEGKRAYCDTIPLHAADNSSVRCDQELEASLLGGVQQRAVAERVPPIGLPGVDGVPGQRAGQPFGVPWSKRTSTGWSVCRARALRHELENRCHLLACHVELFDDLVNA